MRPTLRLLRNSVTRIDPNWDRLTDREQEQRTRIMDLGQALLAIHGRHTMSMAAFAQAIGYTPARIRRHFPDLDSLLAHILHRHLNTIARALGEAGRTHPDDQPALREAYAAVTRTGLGALTEAHLLLTRDRHLLPEDELELLERTRTSLGETLAGEHGRQALLLLDEPSFHPATIEHMLAALQAADPSQSPLPRLRGRGLGEGAPTLPRQTDWASPAVQACLPQGWRPDPSRPVKTTRARAGPLRAG